MWAAVRSRWRGLLEGLWFLPTVLTAAFAALGVAFVYGPESTNGSGAAWAFDGDASAGRVLLSTVAGSVITVAGITFSITIVVLQLTASQLTPRALRNVFADRTTQLTIGVFVGTFVYCLLLLRAVQDPGSTEAGFVPRVGVTVAIAFAVLSVGLLIVFIHHISRLVQVSHVAARVADQTLREIEALYPEGFVAEAETVETSGRRLVSEWERHGACHSIYPARPGFVSNVELERLSAQLGDGGRTHVLVCPGDFVSVETRLADVWPIDGTVDERALRASFEVASERSLPHDAMFGIRQLADSAIRALSPSLNDPTTAVTCVGYLRAVLVRLAGRQFPPSVHRFGGTTVVTRVRAFDEYRDALVEVAAHAKGDAWVIEQVLDAFGAVARAARVVGAYGRTSESARLAGMLADQAAREAGSAYELGVISRAADRLVVDQRRAGNP